MREKVYVYNHEVWFIAGDGKKGLKKGNWIILLPT